MSHDEEYIREFLIECRVGLDRIENAIVALEATPGEHRGLDVALRALHTIKGNSGFLELGKLGAVAHAGESLLSKLLGSNLMVNAELADVLLRLVDTIRNALVEVEATGKEGAADHKAMIEELAQWTELASGETGVPSDAMRKDSSASQVVTEPPIEPSAAHEADNDVYEVTLAMPSPPPQPLPVSEGQHAAKIYESLPAAPSTRQEDSSMVSAVSSKAGELENSTYIRVQIDHLDELMNLVGELVLARNRIVQIASSRHEDEMTEPIQRLNRLTAALQDGVMRTRMQPVRNAWRKYPRIVRDLAKHCGKQCEIELQGGDTELDKSMLESIADPLVHLVRNAIDHGIEKPYLRRIKGKPETGLLLVKAFQESGQVHIEVTDDGAGLDLERIRKKAIEAGVVKAEQAHLISESDLRNSVFLPGFTTADKVTELSGRGVGMDVVKTCVEQIGGTIELQTRKDVGTTIRLTVPLTLAIVPAIIVACGEQRFAIPLINVTEILRLRGDAIRQACEPFHDTPVLRLRGELLPMADLGLKLGVRLGSALTSRDELEILVLKTGTRRFALLVDKIGDTQEIVVKPLSELFASQTEYSGAAMMGDGSIALILDVLGIARSAGLLANEQTMLGDSITIHDEIPRLEEQVLICRIDGDRQIALPLADVLCLENVPFTTVEHSATGDVMQYRGEILPLHQLSRRKPEESSSSSDSDLISVVIYRTAESKLGLLVDRIVDVAQRPLDLRLIDLAPEANARERVIGTAVMLGRVTDFLELT